MPVTRRQVAEYAGVSEATVSYVVNNGPRPVAADTRLRVLDAIRALGYKPNGVAQSLVTRRTSTIGLILPDTANPFFGELARLIETMFFARQYTVMLCNSNMEQSREVNYINALHARRVDGIILTPTTRDSPALELLRQVSLPVVLLDSIIPGYASVQMDDRRGGTMVTRHLIELGHREIACITYADPSSTRSTRFDGYRSEMARAGLNTDGLVSVIDEPNVRSGAVAAAALLTRASRPTAIFAHNDRVALGALSTARSLGLRVPADVSIIGYDDIEEAAYFAPPLTTVAYPKEALVNAAVNLLLESMQESNTGRKPVKAIFPGSLVLRESTAAPPARS
jgi:LacI family transcriptional regulator